MDCSTPGFPVLHHLPELAQTHVRWVGDAIQPSHPLLSPSPPASNPSQHQSLSMSQLFTWGGQSTGASASASVLLMNIQTDFIEDGLVGSPCSPRDSQESFPTPQFKSINSSVLSISARKFFLKKLFTSQAYICSPKGRNLGVPTFNRMNKTGLIIRMAAKIKRGSNVITRLQQRA